MYYAPQLVIRKYSTITHLDDRTPKKLAANMALSGNAEQSTTDISQIWYANVMTT